jgi:hypothetical protein
MFISSPLSTRKRNNNKKEFFIDYSLSFESEADNEPAE